MKKIIVFIFAKVLISMCMAQSIPQTMIDDATELAITLGIPIASTSQIWTEPLFPTNGVVNTHNLRIVNDNSTFGSSMEFSVFSEDQIVAGGTLFERITFDEARTALMLELVNNCMMRSVLEKIYRVRTSSVGDFNIVYADEIDSTGAVIDSLSAIFLIRGAKSIWLRSINGADVQPIAEALDELLKYPPEYSNGMSRTTND